MGAGNLPLCFGLREECGVDRWFCPTWYLLSHNLSLLCGVTEDPPQRLLLGQLSRSEILPEW